ncbi:hypothetical protein HBI24_120880 [Parastagonospora nodorum]|nr:hypothetical protein HBI24_120880 [Parastagonospora nodorum]
MTPKIRLRYREPSKDSSEDDKSGDSKSPTAEDNRKRTTSMKSALSTMRRTGSDSLEIVKKGIGIQTQDLCEVCKKIPFMACIADDKGIAKEDMRTAGDDRVPNTLLHFNSLSDILVNRAFCKFCELLFRCVCQPEYDLLKAPHIKDHLPDSDIKSFPDWVRKNPYWKRELVGGAGFWPFGYAVDRGEAAKSTEKLAKKLFIDAEDQDINMTSRDLDEVKTMYKSGDMMAETVTAANSSLGLMGLVMDQKDEKAQKSMENARFILGQLDLLLSKKIKRLPCVFLLKAYPKDEKKKGALSVRVYGHGREARAPLKEICHFSLRFEDEGVPRVVEQQMWYSRRLSRTHIEVPFFKHCIDTCRRRHSCGDLLGDLETATTSEPELPEAARFRLVDVDNMCVVEKEFSGKIRSYGKEDYVALSYRWGTSPPLQGWNGSREKGHTSHHNNVTGEVTRSRPKPTCLTCENRNVLLRKGSLKRDNIHIPKTIKDAIDVVKAMDQHYLWVDQLCILQKGDPDDKHGNIKRMDQIYNRALFTIVAGDGNCADAGLSGLYGHSSRGEQITEDSIVKGFRMVLPMRMELSSNHWEERAWCLQEKLLSRRILLFTEGFAVWHCRAGTWREDVNALDGDQSSVSFPWLRLAPPLSNPDMTREGLQETIKDESTRLMRIPSMYQYIDAVEDLSRRTIGKSWEILCAFEGLQKILSGPAFLSSPFRMGLPSNFLDVALLWQADEPIQRRSDGFDEESRRQKCPSSWTWAGWEAVPRPSEFDSRGAFIHYEQTFDILTLGSGIVRSSCRPGEERIRPRKGTFYGCHKTCNGVSFKELSLFGAPNMQAKVFRDWDSSQKVPAPPPRLQKALKENLDEHHLIVNTEIASLQLGDDCWKVRTSTKLGDTEHCTTIFQKRKPAPAVVGADKAIQPGLKVVTIVSQEHWINIGMEKKAGTVKFDAAVDAILSGRVQAILLSEAQYLGNEKTPDVLGYPLYNIMLVKQVGEEGGIKFMERIGLGKMYKYAWRISGARKEVIVLQ